jgi:hypothetical protein
MKLRIKGASLRLRVSCSELTRLLAGEKVEETIRFTPSRSASLTYALKSDRLKTAVSVDYQSGSLTILLSDERMMEWGRSEEVAISASLPIGVGHALEIAIEKDFACLDRSIEENADTFENPHAQLVC